jgi:thioredoxin-dependent peroxiredoxin
MFSPVFRVCVLMLALGFLVATAGADDKKEAKVELKVGDEAPSVQLPDENGKTWSSSDRFGTTTKKGKWVVIYFYPGDFTPGCTAQANAFRDAMQKLTEKGVEVVGVSGDSVQTHELFKKAQKLNFTLLADEEGLIAKKYGVPFGPGATVKAKDAEGKPFEFKRAGTAARWTFIVGPDGKIAYVNTKVIPADDAKKITEFITKAEEK